MFACSPALNALGDMLVSVRCILAATSPTHDAAALQRPRQRLREALKQRRPGLRRILFSCMAGLAEAALLNLRLPYPKILTAILRNRLASSSPRTILYLYWTALAVYRTEPGGFPRNPSQPRLHHTRCSRHVFLNHGIAR